MHFSLVDAVLERDDARIVTIKHVTNAEEYLQDHFPGFPVLPGVFMLEAMVQAARALLEPGRGVSDPGLVLGRVRALKYGTFVAPGSTLRVEVTVHAREPDGTFDLKGQGRVVRAQGEPATAVSGRFSLRPVRRGPGGSGAF